jgi:hypothetical protein
MFKIYLKTIYFLKQFCDWFSGDLNRGGDKTLISCWTPGEEVPINTVSLISVLRTTTQARGGRVISKVT